MRMKHSESIQGKTVAVSGSTGGLGRELCRALAAEGAHLLLLDRNAEKAATLIAALEAEFPALTATHLTVDLTDFATVKAAADALCEHPPYALVLNAGAYAVPRFRCDTGWDNVFQINFVAPYYLARRVKDHGVRVVAVGSIAHNYSKTDPNDVDFSTRRAASKVYGNAKRYLMFALYDLFRGETGLSVTHPGITLTGITAHYPKAIYWLIKPCMRLLFPAPKTACRAIVQGVFEDCGENEWIGPCLFDVWGKPKKRILHTCKPAEAAAIAHTAEKIYEELRNTYDRE
ncbi:MAG: SDR family NAD(P)-dependent oxidoreductase [Ruminococcaceae bacterium]|nr:SDR family NAD(P)-dependent oxidoreductase [Oscillospiraceae bacterium]